MNALVNQALKEAGGTSEPIVNVPKQKISQTLSQLASFAQGDAQDYSSPNPPPARGARAPSQEWWNNVQRITKERAEAATQAAEAFARYLKIDAELDNVPTEE